MSALASQSQWYLARDGQQYGPLSDAELAKFIELGHLQPTDLLWREGFPDWRPAMVVFPPRKPAPAPRPAPQARPAPAPAQQVAAPRMGGRGPTPAYQGNPRAAPSGKQPSRADRARHVEPEEDEPRGGTLKKMLLAVVLLAVLGAGGWYGYLNRASLMELVVALSSRATSGTETSPLKGLGGPPQAIDTTLQATPLWRVVKRDFPDWYAERLKEIADLAAQNKDDAAIGQHMARALVALRRQNINHALAAGFPQLKAVAAAFHDNLARLRKHSIEACFAFISQGEASPVIVSLMQDAAHAGHLQAQLTAVFEAIADGRKAARVYPQPRKTDYDALTTDLAKRGWTQDDMKLFSDEKLLARAGPEKVCQLVHDWFAAQLDIKDPDMQLRLLVDSLKPVVAG
jgi:hypothetical protein